ncbi:hypothetical protein JQ607_26975 [Bradyrhizobium liaoningense]|uniref:hypothetical protein n=1 Tax=Bradyrhizobium liaoningense TaxID=43992 RepID=UPI001BA59AC7|nr:hypothetical protein [Bradyrhizobium liaoningense]MBR0843854.1 hypothetical protein [Bradyrhizobium liaoningense]
MATHAAKLHVLPEIISRSTPDRLIPLKIYLPNVQERGMLFAEGRLAQPASGGAGDQTQNIDFPPIA